MADAISTNFLNLSYLDGQEDIELDETLEHGGVEFADPVHAKLQYREHYGREDGVRMDGRSVFVDVTEGRREAEEKQLEISYEHLMIRNRIDMARLFIGKEGGYSIRTFKKMVKRAKVDDPESFAKRMGKKVEKHIKKVDSDQEGEEGEEAKEKSASEEGAEQVEKEPLTVETYKELKEKDLRAYIEEMKADSDDDDPMQHEDLDDDATLAKLLDRVEYEDLGDEEVAEELYEEIMN